MKNSILLIGLIFFLQNAFAQNVRLGIKGGLTIANEKAKAGSTIQKGTAIPTFHAGFLADVALTDNFYVQPQLLLVGKGMEFGNVVYRPYYLELPIVFLYKADINDALKLYGGFGPGIAVGMFGNLKDLDNDVYKKLVFGESSNSDFKRVDITGGVELGVEVNSKLGFGMAYRWSFLDVTRGSNKVTHRGFNFSVAYFFGGGSSTAKKPATRSSTKRS